MRQIKGLLVKDGTVTPLVLDVRNDSDVARMLNTHIGNIFTTCFNVDSVDPRPKQSRVVTGYCDDEFLLTDNPNWSCAIGSTLRLDGPYPIGNPVVILTTDLRTGNTVSMTDKEMAMFQLTGLIILEDRTIPIINVR
jgi:hypothetical protein